MIAYLGEADQYMLPKRERALQWMRPKSPHTRRAHAALPWTLLYDLFWNVLRHVCLATVTVHKRVVKRLKAAVRKQQYIGRSVCLPQASPDLGAVGVIGIEWLRL